MDNIRLEDIKKDLVKLANHLDGIKKTKEADFVDRILNKLAQDGGSSILQGDMPNVNDLSWEDVLAALKMILAKAGVDDIKINNFLNCAFPNPMVIDEIPTNLLKEFMRCADKTGLSGLVLDGVKRAVEALAESIGGKLEVGTGPKLPNLEEKVKEGLEAGEEAAKGAVDSAAEALKDMGLFE
jgi:hypothetical protein